MCWRICPGCRSPHLDSWKCLSPRQSPDHRLGNAYTQWVLHDRKEAEVIGWRVNTGTGAEFHSLKQPYASPLCCGQTHPLGQRPPTLDDLRLQSEGPGNIFLWLFDPYGLILLGAHYRSPSNANDHFPQWPLCLNIFFFLCGIEFACFFVLGS